MGKTKRFHFTKRSVENLPVPASGRARYLDAATRGLGVAVQPSGEKSFFWYKKVRNYPRWETLGRFLDLSIENARDAAEERNTKLATWKSKRYEGPNPFERQRQEVTLDVALDAYIEKQIKPHSKRPEQAETDVRSLVKRYMAVWRERPLSTIKREDVADMHRRIGEKYKRTANVVLKTISVLYNFAERNELYSGANPARGITPYHEPKRTRYLQPVEFPKLGAALDQSPNKDLRDAVGLALTTGARKMNLLSMRWEDISFDHNSWTILDSKNKTPYVVPLTAEAVAILKDRLRNRVNDNPWIFPSYRRTRTGHLTDLKKRWKQALKDAGLDKADLRWHDLRRTQGRYQCAQGTRLLIIGKSWATPASPLRRSTAK
jgi:integrase